jgi:hypothetical protein
MNTFDVLFQKLIHNATIIRHLWLAEPLVYRFHTTHL